MAEPTTDAPAPDAPPDTPSTPPPAAASEPEGDDLAKWKALSRKNEKEAKAARAELERLQAASMSDQEKAVAQARAEGREEASKDFNRKLWHAEVRAQASGLLADPSDAVHLLDLEQFDMNAEPNGKSIKSALEQLVQSKPYLSAQPGGGAGEGGPRGGSPLPLNGDPLAAALAAKVGAPNR